MSGVNVSSYCVGQSEEGYKLFFATTSTLGVHGIERERRDMQPKNMQYPAFAKCLPPERTPLCKYNRYTAQEVITICPAGGRDLIY